MLKPFRVLIGWLHEQEAVRHLLGRLPNAGEDLASHLAIVQAKRAAVASRPPFSLPRPTLEPLPGQLSQRGKDYSQKPYTLTAFTGQRYELGIVNLEQVITCQKNVDMEQAEENIGSVTQHDWDQLFTLCLPDPSPLDQISITPDIDNRGVTFGSLNGNLRVIAKDIQDGAVNSPNGLPAFPAKVVRFFVGLGYSPLHIIEFNNRWFLRDGCHRGYALLRRGITRVPCILTKAASLQETGAHKPLFLSPDTIAGARPPFLKDFLDDRVASTCQMHVNRKFVRIVFDDFPAQNDS